MGVRNLMVEGIHLNRILGVGSHGGSRGHWRHWRHHRHPMNKILNFPFLFPPVIQLFSYHSTVG